MKSRNLKKLISCLVLLPTWLEAQVAPFPFQPQNPIPDEFLLEKIEGSQHPERLKDADAIRIFYGLLGGDHGRENIPQTSLVELLGVSPEAVVELIDIARSALLDEDRQKRVGKFQLCNALEFQQNLGARSDVSVLLAAMESLDDEVSQKVEAFFEEETTRRLGSVTYDYLLLWMEEKIKPGMKSIKIDHAKRDISLGRDPFLRVVRFCEQ